jgi:hypothetical protein
MFVRLESYPNHIEANLAKGTLEAEGIASELRTAAAMELLAVEGVELWVDEADVERAREVLVQHAPDRASTSEEPPPRRRGLPIWVGAVLLIAALTGWGRAWQLRAKDGELTRSSWNALGTELTIRDARTGALKSRYFDRNQNGRFERVETYDRFGSLHQVTFDQDENGAHERNQLFDRLERLRGETIDVNENGRPERSISWSLDGQSDEWMDADENGEYEHARHFGADGGLTLEQLDTDHDDVIDTVVEFHQGGLTVHAHDVDHDGLYETREGRIDGGVVFRQHDGPLGFVTIPAE